MVFNLQERLNLLKSSQSTTVKKNTDFFPSPLNLSPWSHYPRNLLVMDSNQDSVDDISLPPRALKLKVGAPVMLLRNLDPANGLCRGFRLRVKEIGPNALQCTMLGPADGHDRQTHTIPRVTLRSSYQPIRRKQFPVRLAFAMSIRTRQGLTLEHVGYQW